MINEISHLGNTSGIFSGEKVTQQTKSEKTLFKTFQNIFEETDQNLKKADQAVLDANTGENMNLHEMMIAMEKADISLRFMVQVRNKAVDAYNEIMRMQV